MVGGIIQPTTCKLICVRHTVHSYVTRQLTCNVPFIVLDVLVASRYSNSMSYQRAASQVSHVSITSHASHDRVTFIDHIICIDRFAYMLASIASYDHTTFIDHKICIDRITCIEHIICIDRITFMHASIASHTCNAWITLYASIASHTCNALIA